MISDPDKQISIKTYALLDSGSSGCFITENLKNMLGLPGSKTALKLQAMHGSDVIETSALTGLIVSDVKNQYPIHLPKVFTRQEIPVSHTQIPNPEFLKQWPHLQVMAARLPPYCPDLEIGLLIGNNCPALLQPHQVIPSEREGPFAVRYRHGWTISGPVCVKYDQTEQNLTCNSVIFQEVSAFKEMLTPASILKVFESDFSEIDIGAVPGQKGLSIEDQKFMDIAAKEITCKQGHFELPLPFRDPNVEFVNNREQAFKRASWQRRKMLQNQQYHTDYTVFVEKLISQGFAYRIPQQELMTQNKSVWYLPHHGIYHPKKPTKIRVVFDCSARFQGSSLNDLLLQGPDLTNSLIGVLTRFRSEPVAFIADIETMFYQVKVPAEQHDLLRFLWWPNGDLNASIQEYRMGVHIFGAVSSPSIANFALRAAAEKGKQEFGSEVADTICRNFYVDDCLKSVSSVSKAVQFIEDLRCACSSGGFNLTKFSSNNRDVLKSIPQEHHSKEIQTVDLDTDDLPIERALGLKWHVDTDEFKFSSDLLQKPLTRRGLLSTVSSFYDPLGIAAPIILCAKQILQQLCADEKLQWDDEIPEVHKNAWNKWLNELHLMEQLTVERCVKPAYMGNTVSRQIHVFSDASTTGYGCVAYLQLCDDKDLTHVAFLLGKSRLAPLKICTIPRLELTAATVSLQIGQFLLTQLDMDIDSISYYTDSTTVLHYINNESKRFPVFVANRVRQIRDFSSANQWKYVDSNKNPADIASRGANVTHLQTSTWLKGPDCLLHPENKCDMMPMPLVPVCETSIETVQSKSSDSRGLDLVIDHYSDWYRLKRAVSVYRYVFDILQLRRKNQTVKVKSVDIKPVFSVERLESAENTIIKFVQSKFFSKELSALTEGERGRVSQSSSIIKLDPFVQDGVLRVGGRISRSALQTDTQHQIILPHRNHVTSLIIRDVHEKLGHVGRNHVLATLREKYWVIKGNSAVRGVLSKCVTCKRFTAQPCEQKLSDLPAARVNPSPPFTHTGVDLFGPHVVKEGRKYVKRWGVLFTCFSSRAIHLETANSLNTDSFIHALRRFIARRGPVKEIYCDNGTNFVGASRELKEAVKEMDQEKVEEYLLKADITWKFNPPGASHMGGVWERQIKSVRKVLAPLLCEFGERLDDESYRTLLCEVESIVNSRPLTTVSADTSDLNPLMGRSNVFISPPGQFQASDVYMRRRWRQVQYLASLFWSRWKREYLCLLQKRQKWTTPKRNLQVGDIVLIVDVNEHRSNWMLGRVLNTETACDGLVRTVLLKTQRGEVRRPVTKLVFLLSSY